MIVLPGYQITEKIYDGSRTLVYRGVRESDQMPVAIKVYKNEYPSFAELIHFRNQYVITRNLEIPGVISSLALETYRNGFALVMEDFGGVSLKDYTGTRHLGLDEVLKIAISLAQTLEGLYQHRIIHKDIKPQNILINPETQQVKLIDFSIASLLPRESLEIQNPNVLEGTLLYISPEQTGRMNRGIDYRTDFYSLGVMLYELLTGTLPFESESPMELVYFHLAKQPAPLQQVKGNREIPHIVSDIVLKLLEKTPEDRYQSAFGLRFDLETCLQQWETTGEITLFELGQRDSSDRFVIPEKLYGREREVSDLLAAFDRVSAGSIEMMLVAGTSGIGKTAVINEVHKPIVRQRGSFITGKFDQFKRNIPFSAFVQAFQKLIAQLLTETQENLAQWKEKILAALGENAQVIIEVIPELELILGQQLAVPELTPTAAQNRFNLFFERFVQVLATKDHPFVIFLDDLQWADSASLKLIELLMTSTELESLLLLGAYRDNEVDLAHPLILTLEDLRKNHVTINQITLAPLAISDLNRLVADTLNSSLEIAQPLTELIEQKTQGNPFFATQFLKSLYQDGLISFDWVSRVWQCDIARVKALAVSQDVVAFLADQLQKFSESTQNILKLAACIGNQFDLNTLAIVAETTQVEAAADLWPALQEGLILPQSQIYKFYQEDSEVSSAEFSESWQSNLDGCSYKFLHDRVQQAAYFLIPESQKQSTHLKIGQLLLANTALAEREEKIFEIVNQLNIGKSLLETPAAREELAQLNLIAGKKALVATAYTAAVRYLSVGRELLPSESWLSHYELTLALNEKAAEAAYLSADFVGMEQIAEIVIQKAKTLLDQIKIYEVKIQAYTFQNQLLDAVKTALLVLKKLGLNFPNQPGNLNILFGLLETKFTLLKKTSDLLDLPLMKDPLKLAAMDILLSVHSAAYLGLPPLYPLIIFKQLQLSVKYGNTAHSIVAYSSYGLILCGIVGDIETGYQFGILSLKLLEILNAKEVKSKNLFVIYNFIFHWKTHAREGIKPLLEAYFSGLETGDLDFAGYSAHQYCFRLYAVGYQLDDVAAEMAVYHAGISKIKQETALNYHKIYYQTVLNLLGQAEDPTILKGDIYNEEEMLPVHVAANDQTAIYNLFSNKLILSYSFGVYHQAIENADRAAQNLEAVIGSPFVPIFYFYDSLSRIAVFPEVDKPEKKRLLNQVKNNQKKMKKWADSAPINFLHKYYLVEAETQRVFGKQFQAMQLYEQAITQAQNSEYLQEEALAQELAGKFYLAWGFESIAQTYLINAYYSYARWGAKAKVEDLEKRYPQFISAIIKEGIKTKSTDSLGLMTGTVTSSGSGTSAILDLASVIEASQVLSKEIILENLLSTLMQVVIKNAGAEKCVLILQKADSLVIEAIAVSHPDQTESVSVTSLLDSIPIEAAEQIPATLIHYVWRTSETLVFDNVSEQTTFAADPYIIQFQPKSVLCLPATTQGNLVGILYLENNLTTGIFTSDRVEILKVLSSQAAISIENARHYETLEEKVAERTTELAQANQEIATLNQRLQAENLRLSAELEVTRKLQQMLLPNEEELLQIPELEIAGFMEPATEVGGDYYDILPNSGGVKLAIGDVTGHGLESGVLMLMAQMGVRTLLTNHLEDSNQFLNVLNHAIYGNLKRMKCDKNMSLSLLDYQDRILRLSGQHEEMILVRANGTVEEFDTIDLGFPIGLVEDITKFVASTEVELNPGDVVVLYTDGITEAIDIHQVQYGLERLISVVLKNFEAPAVAIRQAVIEDLREYIGEQKVYDDITLLVLKQK